MKARFSFYPAPCRLCSLLFACLFYLLASQACAEDSGKGSDPALVKAIDSLLHVPALRGGFQGIVIQSLQDNSVWYERNADSLFLPASNEKLLTSGTALALLGPDFAFTTRLLTTGQRDEDGTLHGDLILQGSGDPLLTVEDLADLAKQALQSGLRRVTGRLRYNASRFDGRHLGNGWSWDDEAASYSAQVSALNVNKNVVNVKVLPGRKQGAPVQVTIIPAPKYFTLVNTARTGPAKSRARIVIDRMRGRNILTVSGNLPLNTPESRAPRGDITVEDPARFTLTLCAEALQKASLPVSPSKAGDKSADTFEAAVVAEHHSPLLPELLQQMNKPSDNLIAECLFKAIGATQTGRGSASAGAQIASLWFTSLGMEGSQVQMADGSGLSRLDFVSPRNLIRLLAAMSRRNDFPLFYDSLPIAGVDGTLRNRMKNTPAANNCRAKTGTLSHVSSLSGYVTTQDGERLAFSILMNNHLASGSVCTGAQDKIVTLLAGYSRKGP